MLAAAAAVGAAELERFTHGTTIATNALLERRGARTALVATDGFEHVLHLRRQDRAHLYRLCAQHPEPLVPLERCVGVPGGWGRPASSRRSTWRRCPTSATRRRSRSACSSPFATRPTSRPSPRSCGAVIRTRTSSRPTSRRRSSASTSGRRPRPPTPISGRCSAAICGALAEQCADAGLPQPLVMRSSGGVAPLEEAAAHAARALLSGPAAGRGRRRARRATRGHRERDRLRHGRHLDRRLRDRRRRGDPLERARRGRAPDPAAEPRRPHGRRGRRVDCVARQRRGASGGAAERRRRAGPRLLRPRAASCRP